MVVFLVLVIPSMASMKTKDVHARHERALWRAAWTGDVAEIRNIVEANSTIVNVTLEGGGVFVPLLSGWHQAVEEFPATPSTHAAASSSPDHSKALNFLLAQGADPSLGCPLLDALAVRNRFASLRMLHALHGERLRRCLLAFYSNGEGVLHLAARTPSSGFARHVFRTWHLVKETKDNGKKPMQRITSTTKPVPSHRLGSPAVRQLRIVRRLLDLDFNVACTETQALCPNAHHSTDSPRAGVAGSLLSVSKAAIDAAAGDGSLLLLLDAARSLTGKTRLNARSREPESETQSDMSLPSGEFLDRVDGAGYSPLTTACSHGRAAAAVALLAAGASFTASGPESGNTTCAHAAVVSCHINVLEAVCKWADEHADDSSLGGCASVLTGVLDAYNRSALDVARAHGPTHEHVTQWIERMLPDVQASTMTATGRASAFQFDSQRHAAAGWRSSTPAQLAHVGLTPDVLLGTGEVPFACGKPVDEIDAAEMQAHTAAYLDGKTASTSAYLGSLVFRDYLSIGKPFLVRRWVQHRTSGSAGVRPDGGTAEASSPLGSGYFPLGDFAQTFGRIAVQPGGIPYADTYAYSEPTARAGSRGAKPSSASLASFLREHMGTNASIAAASPLRPPYVFDGRAMGREARLFTEVSQLVPEGLHGPPGAASSAGSMRQLIVGPPLSGAMPHFHGSAVNVLLLGVKLWVIVPPSHAEFAQQHAADWFALGGPFHHRYCGCGSGCGGATESQPGASLSGAPADGSDGALNGTPHYLFLQGPGDVVYVPQHWGHAVLNLADSVAVAIE